MLPVQAQDSSDLPVLRNVVSGSGSLQHSTDSLVVNQSSNKLVLDWQGFSIAPDHKVEFQQPSTESTALNRVSGGIPSEIFGALEANGRVFLVNPAGVLFSPSAQVNVGRLIASTLDITQDDFLSGQYIFGGSPRTAVDNQGSISVSNGGLAAFIGAQIDNSGTITAKDGSVLMGAGSRVKVDVVGSLYSLEIQADAVDGLVNQDGIIQANNGRIWLSAGAAADLKSNVINHTGISRANSLQVGPKGEIVLSSNGHVNISGGSELSVAGQEAGKININADTAMLGGVLVASSTGNGVAAGEIELKFEGRLNISGQLQASSDTGKGGFIGVTSGQIIQSASSELNVDGAAGGYIRMDAGAGLLTSGDYTAHGHVSSGGMIDITGSDLRFFSATLNASGQSVGGMVRLGGAFQGGKDVDPDTSYYSSFIGRWGALPSLGSSQQTFINNATQINTNSAAGVGGTAIIWSDDTTTFLGKIDSQGSTGGGSVEISSANDLRKASLANVDVGDGGHLLLDPKNIIIGDSAKAQDWSYAGILGFGYSTTTKNLDVSGLDASGSFGMAVSLNAAGDRMAVGSHSDNGSGDDTNYAGAAYLFSFTDSDFSGGALQATIGKGYTGGKNVDVSSLEAGDGFSRSVSLNAAGNRLVAGAAGDDGSGNGTLSVGAVYLFTSSAETGSYNAESAASFTAHADQGITVSAADLRSRLGLGQNVIFQASNDITLSSDLMVVGSGTGGSLTLRAGRSILLNADMVTNNGDLNLIANDTLANGVVDAHRDTGNAVITMSAGKSINAGTGAVSITLLDGAGKTNLANGDISLRDITAGTITAVNSGSTSGTGITLSSGALTASSSGDVIALSAQKFTNSAGASALSATSGRWLIWSSNADPFDGSTGDTIGGLSYDFRQYNANYDSTAAAQSTGNGFLYTLAPSLSSSLLGSLTKSYDGLASISTLEAGNYSTITGVIGGDTISLTTPATAALNSKEVGNNKYTSVTRAKDSWTNGSIAVYGYQIALSSGNITSITIPTNSSQAFIVSTSGIASRPIIVNSATGMGASDTQYGLAGDQISTFSGSAFQTVKILMDIAKPQKCRIGSGFDLICGNSQNISYQRSVQR